ncbi:MAG TPA: hypothetical protein VFK45_07750 [Gammaproteobacteria bacterium]|nr:hypothetical protein [Gammaproteobacteria bacterium]
MTTEWLTAIELTLMQAAAVLLTLGATAASLIGAALLLAPNRAIALVEFGGTQQASWFWERYFYKRHYTFGALIVVGALYVVVTLLTLGDPADVVAALGFASGSGIGAILFKSLAALLLLGSLLALPFGAIVFIRPSLLKGIERRANKPLGAAAAPWPAIRRPRAWGLFFIAGGLYTLSGLWLAWIA